MRYLALDFETSGHTPGHHAPVSLGVCLMVAGEPVDGKEWLISPPRDRKGRIKREYSIPALEVSGTSWPRLKREGFTAIEVVRELDVFAREHGATELPIVSFNAAFDLAWYADLLFLAGSRINGAFRIPESPLLGPWHCAYMRARTVLRLKSFSLDDVSAAFTLERASDRHGALEDAILAGRVWWKLVSGALAAHQ